MAPSRRDFAALAVCAAVVLAAAFRSTSALATYPAVTGAGSTYVQIALDQWRADIARQGFQVNYQGVGSTAGRAFFIGGQVDFAATELPFQPQELAQLQSAGKSYQYLPDVAVSTSLMFNLHSPTGIRISSLRLDASTVAGIFTGTIVSWQDPLIQSLNPGLQIRESQITPVIRSDGAGTSAQLSLYLADQAPALWGQFVTAYGCRAPCSLWPTFGNSVQQTGSDGVAGFIANDQIGSGSIGYVESGYAYGRAFPVGSLMNASGNFTQPRPDNVSTALTHATLNADLTQNLGGVYRAPESNAYAMSGYSYLITPTAEGFGFDTAKGYVLGSWIIYSACAGQAEAPLLGYSPLPPNLVAAEFDAVKRIPGAPAPPPLDPQHCPNPTVTNPQADQVITFAPLADKILGEPPFGINATASSGLPVTFDASGSCSVAGQMVSLTGLGVCNITARQDGNASFKPAPDVSRSFNILSPVQFAQVVIGTLATMDLKEGTSQRLTRRLQSYIASISGGGPREGCGYLQAFVDVVNDKSGKQIPPEGAALLLTDAARLIVVSACSIET